MSLPQYTPDAYYAAREHPKWWPWLQSLCGYLQAADAYAAQVAQSAETAHAELNRERGRTVDLEQRLAEYENQLQIVTRDCEVFEESAKRIAQDAELTINALRGDSDKDTKSIADILFESAHSAILLHMRQRLDEDGGDEVKQALHRLGQHNLELQTKSCKANNEIEKVSKERDDAQLENKRLATLLEERLAEIDNLAKIIELRDEPKGIITRQRRKKRSEILP